METIDKLGAAARQLNTALELYFEGKEILSIHTLSSASLQLLDDTSKGKYSEYSLESMLKKEFPLLYNDPAKVKEIFKLIRKQQNYLKHADKDPHAFLDFDKKQTEGILLLACSQLSSRYDQLTSTEKLNKHYLNFILFHHLKTMDKKSRDELLTLYSTVASEINLPPTVPYDSEVEFHTWLKQAKQQLTKFFEQKFDIFKPAIEEIIEPIMAEYSDQELEELNRQIDEGRFYSPLSSKKAYKSR